MEASSVRRSAEHVPKYAPFLHLKCAHSQPLHLVGTILALECSWHYKLPEHMLSRPVCIDKLGYSSHGAR
eukprot:1136364-Pelagomonas_calceolata.AAC.2